jgi:hypothetical protein
MYALYAGAAGMLLHINGKIRMIFSAVLVNLLGYLPTVVVPALESNSTTENAKINRPLKIF